MGEPGERDRRRIGDATRQRIDDLAEGWRVPPARDDETQKIAKNDILEEPDAADTDLVPKLEPADLDDATVLQVVEEGAAISVGTTLRRPSVLPRKRGLLGDVRYVFTALFGGTEARRELAELKKTLASERAARGERVIVLGREAVASVEVDLPVVERARDRLADLAEEQSRCAGAVAATDAESETAKRKHDQQSQANLVAIGERESDLKKIAGELLPLEKRASAARDRGAQLRAQLARLDKKIASAEAMQDEPAVQAELASLRAERETISREEPAIAAELDELEPKIAALIGARSETEEQIQARRRQEKEHAEGHRERLEALRARRAVEERRLGEAERRRDEALLELGEELCLERPKQLARRLHPIDEHEVSIATLERRALELSELVAGIDKAKVARGLGLMLGVAAVIGVALIWILR